VPEALVNSNVPRLVVPDTCNEVKVAFVPLALVNFSVVEKILVPVALLKERLVMVEEGVRN
jgi:hypothetical protein